MFDHEKNSKLVKDILKINKISNKSESMKDSLLLCRKNKFLYINNGCFILMS